MVEISLITKIMVFLSSYIPLWLIFLVNLFFDYNKNNFNGILAIIMIGIIIVPLAILLKLIHNKPSQSQIYRLNINTKSNYTTDYLLYVITYIIPFALQDFIETQRFVSIIIMLVFLGVIYIRANLFHLNPILSIIGYKSYKIIDEYENEIILLTRDTIKSKNILVSVITKGLVKKIKEIDIKPNKTN